MSFGREREREGIDGSLADFVRALRGGEPPVSECHGNIGSLAVMMAAWSRAGRDGCGPSGEVWAGRAADDRSEPMAPA